MGGMAIPDIIMLVNITKKMSHQFKSRYSHPTPLFSASFCRSASLIHGFFGGFGRCVSVLLALSSGFDFQDQNKVRPVFVIWELYS
jgi:hypothetical protein